MSHEKWKEDDVKVLLSLHQFSLQNKTFSFPRHGTKMCQNCLKKQKYAPTGWKMNVILKLKLLHVSWKLRTRQCQSFIVKTSILSVKENIFICQARTKMSKNLLKNKKETTSDWKMNVFLKFKLLNVSNKMERRQCQSCIVTASILSAKQNIFIPQT